MTTLKNKRLLKPRGSKQHSRPCRAIRLRTHPHSAKVVVEVEAELVVGALFVVAELEPDSEPPGWVEHSSAEGVGLWYQVACLERFCHQNL